MNVIKFMGKIQNLIGQSFGRLIVIDYGKDYLYSNGKRRIRWRCSCECGNILDITACKLKGGQTKSCGCLQKRVGEDHPNYKGYKDITGKYWQQLEKQAKDRDLCFDINIQDVWDLYNRQSRLCNLTGLPIQFSTDVKLKTASVDRIDSSKGYTIDNIQIIHKDLNTMKMDFDQDYFIKICKLVAEQSS